MNVVAIFVAKRTIEAGERLLIPVPYASTDDLQLVGSIDDRVGPPQRVTVPVAIPAKVRTVGEFFDQMPGAFAERLWDEIHRECSRCGRETAVADAAGVCPQCPGFCVET